MQFRNLGVILEVVSVVGGHGNIFAGSGVIENDGIVAVCLVTFGCFAQHEFRA